MVCFVYGDLKMKFIVFSMALIFSFNIAYAESALINGKVPPGVPANPSFVKQVLSVTQNNLTLTTKRSVLNFNIRTGVRIYQYSGQTCVLDGEMTLYADGAEPVVASAG